MSVSPDMPSPPSNQPSDRDCDPEDGSSSQPRDLLQERLLHPLWKAIVGIVLGAGLGVLCASVITVPIKLVGDKLMGWILPGSAGYTAGYFECAVIGCCLTALMTWIVAGLYGTRRRSLVVVMGLLGVVVAWLGATGASRVADMVAWGAVQDYYAVGRIAHGINDLVDGGESGDEIAGGVSTAFDEMGDEMYYALSAEMMPAAFDWVGLCCLALIAGALWMRFADRKGRGGRQVDLALMGALSGYLVVEWFTGGRSVASWGVLGLVLGLCVWMFGGKAGGWKTARKVVLGCLLAGLGFDLFFGDDSLLWKATLAASVFLSAWVVSAATLRDARLDPRELIGTGRKVAGAAAPPPVPSGNAPPPPLPSPSPRAFLC